MGDTVSKLSGGAAYTVYVKTGDRIGMGTDANIFIAFYNDQGIRSRDIKLDNLFRNDFEMGRTDKFDVVLADRDFGCPRYVEIRREKTLIIDDDWYCEFVKVCCVRTKREIVFPVHRWVAPGVALRLKENDMVLPQVDEVVFQRRNELQMKRMLYEPVKHKETQLVMCRTLPSDESFTSDAMWNLVGNAVKLMVSTQTLGLIGGRWKSLQDIETIYSPPLLPIPAGMRNWKSDKEFGYKRLTGCNPNQIRLCTEIPQSFTVKDDDLAPLLEGMDVAEALNKKRLFIIDYEFLRDLPCTNGRTICAPKALFFVNQNKNLLPVAIQLFPDPGPDNPVFYPSDPEYTWLMAKCYFNNADASIHESATHLGFTHLIGESIAIATNRCLSPSHPIYRLLAPHFLFLIAINNRAVGSLVCEGGWVDKTMAIGRIGMFEIIRRLWTNWRLDVEGSLLADLEERGVADPEVLPNYHYRDDAILMRRAIYDYVRRIVNAYFDKDSVADDVELQEWGRFLGGKPNDDTEVTVGMKGLPNSGQFRTPDELADTVTNFIFLLSVGHAATNFGQYDQYGFPPSYPAWLYGEPPRNKDPLSEKDIIAQLPDKEATLSIMTITKLLSNRGTKAIGDFEMQYIHDPAGLESLLKFRADLIKIGNIVDKRNEQREEKYIYLHPKEVPNAISI